MRIFSFGLLAVALVSPVQAQDISVGVAAGPARAWQVGRCCGPWEAQHGFVLGLTAAVDLSRFATLQLEALHSDKGFRAGSAYWMRQAYVEFPILAKLTVPSGGPWRPLLSLGVAPAVERTCAGRTRSGSVDGPGTVVPLDCDQQRSFRGDVGVVAAVGVEHRAGRTAWSTELRYTHGRENLERGVESATLVTNRAVALVVGVRWRVR